MTTDRDLDGRLVSWLDEVSTPSVPDTLLERSLKRVGATRQRPGWLVRSGWGTRPATSRHGARVGMDRRWVVAIVAVALIATGGLFLKLSPVTTVGPSTSPSSPTDAPSSAPSAAPSAATHATPRPVALIAFMRELDNPPAGMPAGPNRLWVVGADGSDPRDLFPNDLRNDKVDPAWSPDGSRLLISYLGRGKLYLTDADGSDPVLLDTGCPDCADSDATFSSDGARIVFVRNRKESTQGGQAEVWHTVIATMDLATGRVVELDSTAETGDGGPRWSPDGTQIVFSRSWFTPEKFLNAAVFVVDADGQHLRQLTPAKLQARGPDWSPDGSRIVFETLDMRIVNRSVRTSDDIYSIRPDGTDLLRLTTDGLSNGPTWLSDGRILFTRVLGGSSGRAAGGFWVMDADGANISQLVPAALIASDNYYESGGGRDAAWQPVP